MSWVATAVATSAVIGAGTAYMQKREGDKAINAASEANRNALAQDRYFQDRMWEDQAPYRAAGKNALAELRRWQASPQLNPMTRLYMNEGKGSLNRSLASKGLLNSGAAIEAEQGMNQNYLAQDKAQRLNSLSTMAGYGQPNAFTSQYMAGGSGAIRQGGQNQANALLMAGQNRGSMYETTGNMLQGGIRDWMKYRGYGGGSGGVGGGSSDYNDMNSMG